MDLTIFIGRKKIFARAGAHAFESMKKLLFFSIILTLASAAAHSDENSDRQTKLDANASLIRLNGCTATNQILQQLSQESDAQVRVNMLGILSSCRSKITVALIEPFLSDSDPLVRSQAIVTLGALGGKKAVADLENALINDPNIGVRGTAAVWLGSLKDPSSISMLSQALGQEADANIRIQIVQALKSIGTSAAKSALQQGKNDKDARVKAIANE
jgi:HEAT repeat protein